jgi:SAM-dependent methyltransferase
MSAPVDSQTLHNKDWAEKKASDDFYSHALRYPQFADVIAALRPRRLLDVGCGSGYLAKLVKAGVPDVQMDGTDISDVALERARAHFKRVWRTNLDQDPLPAETAVYDTAVCVEVLEHLYDPAHALAEIHRCLSVGGRLVATVPNIAYWRFRLDLLRGRVPGPSADPRHLHSYDVDLFGKLLDDNGFSVVKILGHRVRFPFLADLRPSVFSDILIAVGVRK